MTKYSATLNRCALDYDGLWNKAKEQAESEAKAMYPDPLEKLRREKAYELTLRYYREMTQP